MQSIKMRLEEIEERVILQLLQKCHLYLNTFHPEEWIHWQILPNS